jgi:hypothetical protein
MGTLLSSDVLVYFYLLYVAAWFVAIICGHPRNPPATKDRSPATPPAKPEWKEDLS